MTAIKEEALTPEQIKARKHDLVEFWKEQTEFLNHQKNYEQVITELSELNTRRAFAEMKLAQMMAPPPPEDPGEESSPKMPEIETKRVITKDEEYKRKLKEQVKS